MEIPAKVVAVLWLAFFTTAEVNLPEDNGLMELTADNLELALSTFRYIMVNFYDLECSHCKNLLPEYKKAAAFIYEKKWPMKMAQVDVTLNTEVIEKYSLFEVPTLRFFRSGMPIHYHYEKTAMAIVAFMEEKSGPGAVVVDTIGDAVDFIAQSDFSTVLAGFTDLDSKEAEAYVLVALGLEHMDFAITTQRVVMSHFDLQPNTQVALFRKAFHDKIVFQSENANTDLKTWIQVQSLPYVIRVKDFRFAFRSGIKMFLMLFAAEDTIQQTNALSEVCLEVAKKHREQMICITLMPDDQNFDSDLNFNGLSKSDLPSFALINADRWHKFLPDRKNVVDQTEVDSLLEAYFNGTAKRYIKVEKLPDTWNDRAVKYLTGENVQQVVNDPTKDVMIYIYDDDDDTKMVDDWWKDLAEHLLDDQSILIAEMDGTKNDLEWPVVKIFPIILHFKRETNEMVKYEGNHDFDSFLQYVTNLRTPSENAHSEL